MNPQGRQNGFDRMLEQLCVDELTEQEWRELAAKIADDETARRRYIEAIQWRESVGHLLGGEVPPRQNIAPVSDDLGLIAPETPYQVPSRNENEVRFPARDGRGRFFGAWSVAVSLAFLSGAAITAIALQRGNERPHGDVATVSREPLPTLPAPLASLVQENQLGKVSGLSLDASADGLLRSLQVGQELRCGEVVQLTVGFMRVALHSGPELIVEGPAEFSIIGTDAVFVRIGRVAARSSENLLLQSPLLTAECNDADVAFVADEDSSTNVYAYQGVVTMRNTAHRRANNRKLAVLHKGQGLLVRPQSAADDPPQIVTAPPKSIARTWAEIESRLTDFERLVLSDRPTAYWPLHRVRRNRRVLDLTQHGFDGQAIGNWPVELSDAAAAEERGAYFNGESYIEPDRKPPIDLRRGFTIEAWAKVQGGPNYQSIFTSRWVLDAHTPHLQCLGFTLYAGKDDTWQLWTGSGRYGQLWKELHTDVQLVRHRWTHVVASFEPEENANGVPGETIRGVVRIYVDGQLAAKDVHEMSLMDFEWPARIGAAEFVPNSLTAWLFRGTLRDIAVYDYPLEPVRIKAHYEAGRNAG